MQQGGCIMQARRMFAGWVQCDNFDIHEAGSISTKYMDKLMYNPIKDIHHWRRGSDDGEFSWDGSESMIVL